MLNLLDNLLNRITMYRLVLYVLLAYLLIGFIASAFGLLSFSPLALAYSALVLVAACYAVNRACAWFFDAHPNVESVYITALILALIITPIEPANLHTLPFLLWAAVFAMGSKYILVVGKKHIFNPAALAVVATAFIFGQYASWWVGGNLTLLPLVLVGGLLVARKIQRFDVVLAATVAALGSVALTSSGDAFTTIEKVITHTPLIFFATIMVSEPLTTPPTRGLRLAYGALAGILFAPALHVGPVYATPELALVVANVFSFVVSPKYRETLKLKEKREIASGVWEFVFVGNKQPAFLPGQYMEWTLAHKKSDSRGNRRYFTIASSPSEGELRLGVRLPQAGERTSSFKTKLASLALGDTLVAGGIAGDFTLPGAKDKKLVFIAGGIGVTPFRSMIQHLLDKQEARPVTMFYSNKTAADIAYKDIFDRAESELGTKMVYVTGALIDADLIAREVPDYRERTFYISGPHSMVDAFKKTLTHMGVSRLNIKSDFFPGFV